MNSISFGNIHISVGDKGDLLLIAEASLPIDKDKAKRIFGGGFSSDPNSGLFPMDAGGERICLSVMPDDVAKIALTKEQVSAIKRALSI